MSKTDALPIACSLNERELALREQQVKEELFAGVEERTELESGYAFRFPGDNSWKNRVENFVATERECCQFFRMSVTHESGLGPIWLSLTGPAGVKEFIDQTFGGSFRT